MSHGIRVWGPTGLLELDENSFTVRIVYSAIVSPAGARFVDISIPEVNTTNYSAVCVPVGPYNTTAQFWSAIMFTPIVDDGFVRVCFGNPSTNTGPLGTTAQRLIVMRYR